MALISWTITQTEICITWLHFVCCLLKEMGLSYVQHMFLSACCLSVCSLIHYRVSLFIWWSLNDIKLKFLQKLTIIAKIRLKVCTHDALFVFKRLISNTWIKTSTFWYDPFEIIYQISVLTQLAGSRIYFEHIIIWYDCRWDSISINIKAEDI